MTTTSSEHVREKTSKALPRATSHPTPPLEPLERNPLNTARARGLLTSIASMNPKSPNGNESLRIPILRPPLLCAVPCCGPCNPGPKKLLWKTAWTQKHHKSTFVKSCTQFRVSSWRPHLLPPWLLRRRRRYRTAPFGLLHLRSVEPTVLGPEDDAKDHNHQLDPSREQQLAGRNVDGLVTLPPVSTDLFEPFGVISDNTVQALSDTPPHLLVIIHRPRVHGSTFSPSI